MTYPDPLQNQVALDLMAQLQDPQWAREAARIEDEANCDISAGRNWGDQLAQFMSDPEGFHQTIRLRTLVLAELRQILLECNLGAGLEAAQALGKSLLLQRLQHPSPEIQTRLRVVLSEDLASESMDIPLSATAQTALNQVVRTVLTPVDWEAIAATAGSAIEHHLKTILSLPKTV